MASVMAIVAEIVPSTRLKVNASMNRGLARIALNQRSESPLTGSEMKPSDVNATAHTITMGARMNRMNAV